LPPNWHNVHPEKTETSIPSPELIGAVGSLIQADPARVIALASSLRAPNRWLESTVEGRSMGRSLPPGSRIRIELTTRERYEAGEVVAFLAGRQVVVHRVVHRGRRGAAAGFVLTRGDAPLVPDPPVRQAQVLGPVSAVWREGGWAQPPKKSHRSFRARFVASAVLLPVLCMLYVSPRATTIVLDALHRLERRLRNFRARRLAPGRSVRSGTD
jgi:hypothetical protein